MKISDDRIPVIVGVGEITDRPTKAEDGLEPIRLMETAARMAEQDAGAALFAGIDSIDVVCEVSWPYLEAPRRLGELLSIRPARAVYGPIGGESPVRFVHEAALRIMEGESQAALVVGAEAEYTVSLARKQGVTLAWETRDNTPVIRGKDYMHRQAVAHGVAMPVTAYPLFENATIASWGQTPAEAHRESAALWAKMSEVAANNPHAWRRERHTAEEIGTANPPNRMIAFPYTKRMVANPLVNQGAATIVCSLAYALAAGVPEEKMVYFHSGAAASEPRDYLERAQFIGSPAQTVVLEAVLREIGGDAAVFDAAELYSCFPIVPKIASRVLNAPGLLPTVAGGLSFFGAPLNNYMSHAIVAMVRRLRQQENACGLLYGNGGFMTYHHALVLITDRARANEKLARNYSVQAEADARQLPAPAVVEDYTGTAVIETFTVIYDRDGVQAYGTVIARTPHGARVFARVRGDDAGAIARLEDPHVSPIGLAGRIDAGVDGLAVWHFA